MFRSMILQLFGKRLDETPKTNVASITTALSFTLTGYFLAPIERSKKHTSPLLGHLVRNIPILEHVNLLKKHVKSATVPKIYYYSKQY